MLRTIPAKEIKRRGISAVDDLLCGGPVHVIRDDEPKYVIMTEAHYADLVESYHEAYVSRVEAALEDVEAGRVTRGTAEDLIRMLELEE